MMRTAYLAALCGSRWEAARADDEGVEVRVVEAPSDGPPEAAAPALVESLRELGYRGRGLCLALPSSWLLVGRVEQADLPRRGRHAALLFRLEDQLPLDAEQLTADFLAGPAGTALGVAVQTERVCPLLEALAEQGLDVEAACPTALLAAASVNPAGTDGIRYVLVAAEDGWDLLRMSDGRPADWHTVRGDADELARTIRADLLSHPPQGAPPPVTVVGTLDEAAAAAVARELGTEPIAATEASPVTAAARAARSVLAGRLECCADLRRDALAARSHWQRLAGLMRPALALAVLLPAVVAGLAWHRAWRYEQLTRRYEQAQAAAYQKLYPNGRVPANVKARLASERQRLSATSGEEAQILRQRSALDDLRDLVAFTPRETRLLVRRMQIGPAAVVVEGEARSHGDAETFSQAIRRAGFDVDPPTTEQLTRGGVAFTVTARPAARGEGPGAGRSAGRAP